MSQPNAIEHGRRTAFILDPDTWRPVGFRLHKGVLGSRRQAVAASRRRSQRRSAVGLFGLSDTGGGVVGVGGTEAGRFLGAVTVAGTMSKSAGQFKVDHPLDLANKDPCHAWVESSEMKNVYDGVATLDERGEATVELWDWFEEVNTDLRYQLTSIGAPAHCLHVSREVAGNQFRIAGATPGLEVSWQVTGVRHDQYAQARPTAGGTPGPEVSWQVTGVRHDQYAQAHTTALGEEKPPEQRGHYLDPDLHGQPPEGSMEWAMDPTARRQVRHPRAALRAAVDQDS